MTKQASTAYYKNHRIIKTSAGYLVGRLTYPTLEAATQAIDGLSVMGQGSHAE